MSKFIKVLAVIMSAVMLTVFPVSAFAEEKIAESYTLEQLFAMSDEEFFALKGRYGNGEDYYNEIKADAERVTKVFSLVSYGGISGQLGNALSNDDNAYVKDETENKIKNVLGDTVKYDINSPSFSDEYYSNIFTVDFPDYFLPAEETEITDKQIKEFAKCYFCVNQVFEMPYTLFGSALAPAPKPVSKATLLGDVDLNGYVDLADLTKLAKYNLSNSSYPLENETAYANADMNGDDVVDGLDTSALIENQLGK